MTLVGKQNHQTLPQAQMPPVWATIDDALQDFHLTLQPQRVMAAIVRHFAALFQARRTALLLREHKSASLRLGRTFPEAEAPWVARWLPQRAPALHQALEERCETPWQTWELEEDNTCLYTLPLRLPEGEVLGTVVVWPPATHTPSEQAATYAPLLARQAALALRNAQQHHSLHTAWRQLQTVWDALPEGALLFSPRGRLLAFNAAAKALLGEALQSHLGQSVLDWARHTTPARVKQLTGLSPRELRAYARRCSAQSAQVTHREFAQTLNNETRYVRESCLPLRDAQGRLQGWLVVWGDVTESRRQELLRQELSNMIVHDLRNPITSIASSLLMLRELLEEERDTALLIDVVEIAHNSTTYLLNLVQSILDVARMEQGQMVLDCESQLLGDCVKDAIRSLSSQALRAEVTLTADIPADLPPIWADEEKIRRVLMNLLDNAIRHTPQGGRVHVSAYLNAEKNRVITCVADSGPGVPPEARARIFEKYAQLKHGTARGYKGVGLGLTFCKLAVEAHGGRIWVEDAELGGAAFCFSLPLAPFA